MDARCNGFFERLGLLVAQLADLHAAFASIRADAAGRLVRVDRIDGRLARIGDRLDREPPRRD